MSFYQKFGTSFAGKKTVLLLAVAFFTITSTAQRHVKFAGEWKLNDVASEVNRDQFPLCIFGGDRMRSKTLKIISHPNFLTVNAASSAADGALVTRQEKLTFDGKENKAMYVGAPREESAARWSDDGQTMTVSSVRSFDKNGKTADFKVTEIWKLINDGKSISIQVISRSDAGEKIMKLIYDKQYAADYRF